MIYFLHIPKTGGSSIQAMLKDYAERTARMILGPCLIDDLIACDRTDWTAADILCGHVGSYPLSVVPDVKVITVLRDPLTHLHSWYRHVLRAPDHYLHDAVRSEDISFSDWLDWPPARMLVDNPQARYLGTHALMKGEAPKNDTSLQQAWEVGAPALNGGELERAARHTLDTALAVGCLEQLDDFQRQLAAMLGQPLPKIFHENVDPIAAHALSAAIKARISNELCPIDSSLYKRYRCDRPPAGNVESRRSPEAEEAFAGA